MRVKDDGASVTYSYTAGNELIELELCKKEIAKINELLPFQKFAYKQAKKIYKEKQERLEHLIEFLPLLEADIANIERRKKND